MNYRHPLNGLLTIAILPDKPITMTKCTFAFNETSELEVTYYALI